MSDDFGSDSDDLADFIAAETRAIASENGKRKREDEDEKISPAKHTRIATSPSSILANKVLKKEFGLDGFRSKQEAAITRLLDGESAVIIFPTGAGKSLCYQVPAVAFKYQDEQNGTRVREQSGITLVISPLIALMKDQVDALLRRKIRAAMFNSTMTRDQYIATQEDLRRGRLDLLYCAPERLNIEGFIASLKAIPGGIRLLAVDEAHCISEWGHSFRPDYLKIARFAQEANVERIACLTATATPKVAQDICDAFFIPREGLFVTTTYRPNLRLLAQANTKDFDYVKGLVTFLEKNPGPTIVYVTIQKGAFFLADSLVRLGFPAKPYHAGMPVEVRSKTQDEFLASDKMIIVATIAFGMGIDKPNIRNIVHFDQPSSIESYSQQIGRAGRDGLPSVCFLNFSTKDFYLRNLFTYGDRPSKRSLRLLLNDIVTRACNTPVGETFRVSLYQQSRDVDIGTITLGIIYAQLELRFKLLRATDTVYNDYKYIPTNYAVLASDRSVAAQAILRASSASGKWSKVDLSSLAACDNIPRVDLVRKLDEWNERGLVQLDKSRVETVFRLESPISLYTGQEIEMLVKSLDTFMDLKEKQDLDRTQALIRLITAKKCYSLSLAQYFGEPVDGTMAEECGHCTWCETHKQVVLPNEPPQPPDPVRIRKILDAIPARDDPRYLAKIAFGVKSPRATAERVFKTGVFESMNVCDFPELLKIFTKVCVKGNG